MKRPVNFTIEKLGQGLARAGVISTPHGDIRTPAFIAVGTKATVKGIAPERFDELGIQSLIANTYHLFLTPGEQLIEKAGGLHAFMGWDGPLMTDSGGFQVFSLGEGMDKKVSKFTVPDESVEKLGTGVRRYDEDLATSHGKLAIVDDEGVSFTSHIDGSFHRFTPERSIEIQHALGADIMFAFDECTSPTADYAYQNEAMDRTHAWARRSLAAHRQNPAKDLAQGLYGIVQGGRYEDLRIESARTLADMDFDGYGIGGSFSKDDLLGILDKVNAELPQEKPRHLLGIGEPEDLFMGVAAGIDTFDCVLPTRNGRTGTLYTREGKMHITSMIYRTDFDPIDRGCDCFVCENHSRAYISHLFRSHEMLGPVLASAHNIRFLTRLAEEIRESILSGTFEDVRKRFLETYAK